MIRGQNSKDLRLMLRLLFLFQTKPHLVRWLVGGWWGEIFTRRVCVCWRSGQSGCQAAWGNNDDGPLQELGLTHEPILIRVNHEDDDVQLRVTQIYAAGLCELSELVFVWCGCARMLAGLVSLPIHFVCTDLVSA